MIKRTREELTPNTPPAHFGMVGLRIHGKSETGAERFWVNLTTFLPGGGAEYGGDRDNPTEKFYYVLEGEMTITDKDGAQYVLRKDDSISFAPNEGRSILNRSNRPTVMLVVSDYAV